jgi:ferric-dicitrate binding protein FerR (iron transport regulator)
VPVENIFSTTIVHVDCFEVFNMMTDFKDLYERYLADRLTPDEAGAFLDAIGKDDNMLPEHLDVLLREKSFRGTGDPEREERLFRQIMEKDKAKVRRMPVRWLAAASVLLLLLAGSFVWVRQVKQQQIAAQFVEDAQPGKQGAVLTLADGKQVTLDSLGNGTIATQSGTRLLLNNGRLSYNNDKNDVSVSYNTLSTARGRQFQLVLPDGSKVWLNAASSVRYPVAFSGTERTVEISGEAYFEIAADASMPFRVKINETTTVEVLGTRFNINAYREEKGIHTTLSEGAVRVKMGNLSAVLAPGQQAIIQSDIQVIRNANIDQALAWKEGLFNFQDMPFDEVMRQLSRWYDIDVVYENGIPDIKFEGELGRDVSLSKILFFLSKVDVHYRIEDRKKLVISK